MKKERHQRKKKKKKIPKSIGFKANIRDEKMNHQRAKEAILTLLL